MAIDFANKDFSKYDLLIIGTPVWAGTMVPAVRSFIKKLPVVQGQKIVVFSTHKGGPGKVFDNMENLLLRKGYRIIDKEGFLMKKIHPYEMRQTIRSFCAKLLGTYK